MSIFTKYHFYRKHETDADRTNCGSVLVSIYGRMVSVQNKLGVSKSLQAPNSNVLQGLTIVLPIEKQSYRRVVSSPFFFAG